MKVQVIRYWEVRDEVTVDLPDETKLTEQVKQKAIEKAHAMPLCDPEYASVVDDSINSDPEVDVQEVTRE